jgi:Spy/CpxP family protein refolding chaperone
MTLKPYFLLFLGMATTMGALAQDQIVKKAFPNDDTLANPPMRAAAAGSQLMERNFFEPDLVMRHQKTIGLTGEQQQSIRADSQKTMSRFTELQWKQSAEVEAMMILLKEDRPDEKAVLAQLDKVLIIENEIKRVHAGLLVRIRNALTPEQRTRLREIKYRGTPFEKGIGPKAGEKPAAASLSDQ